MLSTYSSRARDRECDLRRLRRPRPSPANSAGRSAAGARSTAMWAASIRVHSLEIEERPAGMKTIQSEVFGNAAEIIRAVDVQTPCTSARRSRNAIEAAVSHERVSKRFSSGCSEEEAKQCLPI